MGSIFDVFLVTDSYLVSTVCCDVIFITQLSLHIAIIILGPDQSQTQLPGSNCKILGASRMHSENPSRRKKDIGSLPAE